MVMDWAGEYQRSADLVPQADEIDDYPRLERTLGQIDALTRSLAAHAGAAQVAQAAAEGGAAAAPMQLGAPPASEADERAAARVLAREGFDSDRLRRDVRGLELQTTFEDVFPVEHTSLEKYLESVHNSVVSSALMTAEQRLLKDYDDFVEARLQDLLEEDKRKLMQAYGRAAMTSDGADSALAFGAAAGAAAAAAAAAASTGGSAALSGAAGAFSAQAKAMNDARDQRRTYSGAARLAKAAREHGAAQAARCVYEVLSSMLGEQEAVRGAGSAALVASGTSGEMALVAGARGWLEAGHATYMLEVADRYREQAGLGGSGGGLARVHAFLRVGACVGDYAFRGVRTAGDAVRMDFDGGRFDTTWQRLYYLVRSGYAAEAAELAEELRGSAGGDTAQWLREWAAGGATAVTPASAAAAAAAADRLLAEHAAARAGAVAAPYGALATPAPTPPAPPAGTREALLLHAMLAGDRHLAQRVEAELAAMGQPLDVIEDYMWFKIACVRAVGAASISAAAAPSPGGFALATTAGGAREECTLSALCASLAAVPDEHYTSAGREPLLFVMVLLLTQQFAKALDVLRAEAVAKAFPLEAPHVAAVLAHHRAAACLAPGAAAACARALDGWAVAAAGAGHGEVALEYAALAAAAEAAACDAGDSAAVRSLEFREAWGERVGGRGALEEGAALACRARHLLRRGDAAAAQLLPRGSLPPTGVLASRLGGAEPAKRCVAEAAYAAEADGSYSRALELHRAAGAYAAALALANRATADALSAAARRAGAAAAANSAVGAAPAGGSVEEALRLGVAVVAEAHAAGEQGDAVLSGEMDALETLKAVHTLLDASARGDARAAMGALPRLPLPQEPFRADAAAARVPELHAAVRALLPDLLLAAARVLHAEAAKRGAVSDAGRVTRTQLEAIRAYAARAPLGLSPAASAQLAMYLALD